MSDSTAGTIAKEKFRRLDEVLVQEYDMNQVTLTSEINAEPKMFPYVFTLFFFVLASIMPNVMFRAK